MENTFLKIYVRYTAFVASTILVSFALLNVMS